MSITIWHNPRCSKSRQTLALLQERGVEPVVRLYLEDAPTEAELREALTLLGLEPSGLVRKGEPAFKERGLKEASEEALLAAMVEVPKMIERPIVFANGKAALGRPPEQVLEII
ncbi:MAG: arsenate reductase (glutaredoxin) [Silicimonas sp.]|nr:arsenate reductase (glutaredoxin) [Silicimonas sp.]